MLYLLDANVPIDANRDYYPIERVPEFWEWLVEMGELGRVKIPIEIYEEIILPPPSRADVLVDWLKITGMPCSWRSKSESIWQPT